MEMKKTKIISEDKVYRITRSFGMKPRPFLLKKRD